MSTDIVLLSLINWTESLLTAILNATTEATFNEAFDAFLSQDVHITVNGKHVTREQYKKQLSSEKWTERTSDPASVAFEGAVEVPADKNEPISNGVVGLFYKATIYGRFFILGAPSASTVNSSLNVVIAQDKSIPAPVYPPGVRGDFDDRRVTVLNQVVTDQANPIVLPKPLAENSA
ncbi:hypothetical protein SCP_1004730 [Sparassis crispa]|uniref:Uncharacterized protein n=1 Tax=Sparassis crispa TaxID=139825 RepID=A0A401GYD4_9APHY|nr:hypothetical protein SCP_1004730 [Sparassis crispa]GBE87226.1 hypothetical protein SCP_1004730 [Sparassis crispa]